VGLRALASSSERSRGESSPESLVILMSRLGGSADQTSGDRLHDRGDDQRDRAFPSTETCGRLGGGPLVFADCSFGTLDDQSSSGGVAAGSATKENCDQA
jgi:hypothetical protein